MIKTNNLPTVVKIYGTVGFLLIILSTICAIYDLTFFDMFFTPLVWTGYVLFLDAVIFALVGRSLIASQTKRFFWMLPLSVICWGIFEVYNLHIQNWHYVNLPESIAVRLIGYSWSFATIFPGIFLSAELFKIWGVFGRIRIKPRVMNRTKLWTHFIFGLVCVVAPVLLPEEIAHYAIAPVWIGFVFLFEPVNYVLGGKSLLTELESGEVTSLLSLFAGGLLCGILWETWNHWALTKWVYDLPYLSQPKIFEMPLAGFLGFLPFALECFSMYNFVDVVVAKLKS